MLADLRDTSSRLSQRVTLDRYFADLERAAEPYRGLWEQIDAMLPSRARFAGDSKSRGGGRSKSTPQIVDGTALRAHLIARSGMLAGLAPAGDTWFELAAVRPALKESQAAKEWLRRVRDILLAVFDRSNTYASIEQVFGDELGWGTGCMIVLPDDEDVVRCETFPIGSYFLGQSDRGVPDALGRRLLISARNIKKRWGEDVCSARVRTALSTNQRELPIEVRHLILPVDDRWLEFYYEAADGSGASGEWDLSTSDVFSGPRDGILAVGMFEGNPIIAPRWEHNADEVWASRWPVRDALGDILELQSMRRGFMNALAKQNNPPIVVGPGNEQTVINQTPGGKTVDPNMSGASTGARELHQTRVDLSALWQTILDKRQQVEDHLMVRMWLSILLDQRAQPRTAEEIIERRREKATIQGPIKERQADQLLDPFITMVMTLAIKRSAIFWAQGQDGILPLPPEELVKEPLRVRYVSDIAASQRNAAFANTLSHLGLVGQLAQLDGSVLDTTDFDEVIQLSADNNGVAPSVTRTDEAIAAIRQQRAEAQQAAAAAEQQRAMAETAAKLGSTPLGQGSALDAVLSGG